MILAYITLLSALFISAVAAFFSVTGLAALFSASYWSVIIMASAIEIGKLAGASWLKMNWKNELVSKFHKMYLVIAILICMFITSLGIFGFLSNAHIQQNAPIQKDLVQMESIQQQIDLKKQELETAYTQLSQLNKSIITGKDQPALERERRTLQTYVKKLNNDIQDLTSKILVNKQNVSSVDIKLGPVKYLADLLYKDPIHSMDRAVQLLIMIIIVIFDPLAICLLLSSQISFQQLKRKEEPKLELNQPNLDVKKEEQIVPMKEEFIEKIVEEVPNNKGKTTRYLKDSSHWGE